eukprot:12808-Heterococcus_DN1.PRE.1
MQGNRITLALSFSGLALAECCALALMLSMWTRRKSLLVRARSPALAMVSRQAYLKNAASEKHPTQVPRAFGRYACFVQGGFIMMLFAAIIVQEILKAHDIAGYPCPVMMWTSIIAAPMYLTALELRALRVVIVSNANYRVKYSKLASSKLVIITLCGIRHNEPLVPDSSINMFARHYCVAIAVYLQFTRTQETLDTDFCFCMQPWLLMIALVIGLTYPTIWLNRCVSLPSCLPVRAKLSSYATWCLLTFLCANITSCKPKYSVYQSTELRSRKQLQLSVFINTCITAVCTVQTLIAQKACANER